MCHIGVLQRICCNQVIIPPLQRCSTTYPCGALSIDTSWVPTPCTDCEKYGFLGHFIGSGGVESDHIWFLDHEQNKRVRLAVDNVVKAAEYTGSKWNFVLRIDWPVSEEEIITLERKAIEFPGELKAAIMRAESDARDREELVDLLGQMSLCDGNQAEGKHGKFFGGRLLLSSESSVELVGAEDDELVVVLERLMLTS